MSGRNGQGSESQDARRAYGERSQIEEELERRKRSDETSMSKTKSQQEQQERDQNKRAGW